MNDTQIIENLDWALDAIDDGDMGTAVDYIRRVRDHFQEKADVANESVLDAAYADARDHHLINQNFNRAVGKK